MPTYEYSCKACGEHLEVVQSFKDDALTTCPACGGPLRKVFGSIGIAFKGSGFYRTDSRSGPPKERKAAAEGAASEKSADAGKSSSTAGAGKAEKGEKKASGGDKAAKSTTSTAASA